MKILLYSSFYLPGYKGGGPIKTIANLIHATSDEIDYCVVTKDRDLGDREAYSEVVTGDWNKTAGTRVFYSDPGVRGTMEAGLQIFRVKYDLVYLNSFFSPFFSFVPLLLSKLKGKPAILGPRGEFSQGALSLKSGKKKIFIFLFKTFRLHENVYFQASTPFEAEDIRRVFGENVNIHVAEDIGSFECPAEISEKKIESLRLVYISRISRKKNLAIALDILKTVTATVTFHIYGPIEDVNYWKECEATIDQLPDNVEVEYMGQLHPKDVVSRLAQYDLFFLPTKGENFGHVIAEALCAGLPTLISDQTPWRNLEEQGIGWDIPLSEPARYVSAIERAYRMSPEEYASFRHNILSWAKQKFENREAVEANKIMFSRALKQYRK